MTKNIHCFILVLLIFSQQPIGANEKYIVSGYYPAWMRSELPVRAIKCDCLTHVFHAFAWPNADGSLGKYDEIPDKNLVEFAHEKGVKVLIALGGWGNCENFAPVTADAHTRSLLVENLLDFCRTNGYDGVNIDWEYPSSQQESQNLNLLIAELDNAIKTQDQKLSVSLAVPAGDWNGRWFDFQNLQQHVDFFCCMTYDFFGAWVNRAGHNSPLYPPTANNNGSVSAGIAYLTETRLVDKNKVLVGIPFYGRGCRASGLNHPNLGENVEYRYNQVISLLQDGWYFFWDPVSKVPYLMNPQSTHFVSFDDTTSVRFKVDYMKTQQLGGLFIWALGQDMVDTRQPLLESVGRALTDATAVKGQKSGCLPEKIKLVNYPNPFNGETTIEFILQKPQTVTLLVINLLGQVIDTPVESEQMSSGVHRYRFDGGKLPSGIFICQLQARNAVSKQRMVLLR
ncbi:T9SS type A sorting domain-containing protein [candidate division KSB1 bacterium]|nr:T9SS type A sorting domain-containing protein [candidate division KSB1 bacterium]